MKAEIRQLNTDDWLLFREMRLQALKECERVYLSSYEDGLKSTEHDWKETLNNSNNAIFLIFDKSKPIGLGAVFTRKDDPSGKTAVLAMGFIIPEYRGKGLSHKLYEARIEWAKQHPLIEKLYISHREGNKASKSAMLSHGFKFMNTGNVRFGDGSEDIDYNYELQLKKSS